MAKRSYNMAFETLYRPLDHSKSEIRLVQLRPGAEHEPLQFGMKTIDLETKGQYYNALSYEWGSPLSQREITIEGTPLMIRENLWNALHQFRSSGFYGPFWVDALCVNQADILERNSQVKLMHTIYSEANLVRIWLGKEGQQSGEALALLWKIFRLVQDVMARQYHSRKRKQMTAEELLISHMSSFAQEADVKQNLNLHDFFEPSLKQEQCCEYCAAGRDMKGACSFAHLRYRWEEILCSSEGQWQALSCLLNRTYWSRVWIVQEYVLAPHKAIHCGKDIISSDDRAADLTYGKQSNIDMNTIEVALSHIISLDLGKHPGISTRTLDSIVKIQNSPGTLIMKYATPWLSQHRSLMELLVACKNSQATEPRDRIYAMLGLAWDIWDFEIEFDYSKSISQIKLDMLGWYIGSDANSRQQLWSVLNEMVPEKLSYNARNELEKKAQKIIKQALPVNPHVLDVQQYLEDFDIIYNSLSSPNQELGNLPSSLEASLAWSTSVRA